MRKPFVRQDRVAQIVEYPCVPVQVDGGDGMVEVAKRILQDVYKRQVYREPAGVEISTYYGLHMLSQSYEYTVIY